MKVTIVISCYNQGRYLIEALDSVLAQTFKKWECIIINDGSTDNTDEIAKSYIEKDVRFRYIYQANYGVCRARNNAVKVSLGEYILCLDADDKISSKYVELCVKELDRNINISLVVCNYKYFGKAHRTVLLEPYSIERLMGHNLFVNCSMFRKSDFIRVNGFNENMRNGLEDWDFWLSILSDGQEVKYLDGVYFYYRIKSPSKSRNSNSKLMNTQDILRKQLWQNHKKLYANIYSSPFYSAEYLSVASSREYQIGKIILIPFRFLWQILHFFV